MTIRVNRAPGRLLTAVAAVSLGLLLVANALGDDAERKKDALARHWFGW